MKYLNSLKKYIVFQVVLGLIGMGHVFGGSAHISGVGDGHSGLGIMHVSGAVYSGDNSPTAKTHVSGSKMVHPVQKPESVQSRMTRKARSIGITLGSAEKSTSIPVRKKTTGKTKKNTRAVKIVGQASLRHRIKQRKACWKKCENAWKFNVQERCSVLSDSLRQHCKKKIFKERLSCVSQNCIETTQ